MQLIFLRNWVHLVGIIFLLAHCSSSPNVVPATKSDTATPSVTEQRTSPQNRVVYKIKGPKDSMPPGRYSVVEWEESDVHITGEIEANETDDSHEQIFGTLVRSQKQELLRCARLETDLWYANFFPNISYSKSKEPVVDLEHRFIATRTGIAENNDKQSLRLTACILHSLEKSMKTTSVIPVKDVSFRLSFSWPNPEQYITVGKLQRFNGKTDLVTVDTSGDHLCGADKDGKVTCWSSDKEFSLPESFGRFQKLSLHFENGCGLDFKGRIRCWSLGETIEKRFAPNKLFNDVSTGDEHACGISEKGRLLCWSVDKATMIDMPKGIFKRLSCGNDFVCAINSRDEMLCVSPRDLPTWDIEWKQQGYADVSVGGNFVCALSLNGELECHVYSRDKIGDSMGRTDSPKGAFQKVACGLSHCCAINKDEQVVCWGDNRVGQSRAPEGRFETVSAGQFLSCGIRKSDALECWGNERLPDGQWE